MKTIGVTRRIDDLGRVVIPKEFRQALRIRIGDLVEISLNKSGELTVKKYSPVGELGNFAREYTESLGFISGMTALICDTEQFISSSNKGKDNLLGKRISDTLRDKIIVGSLYEGEQLIPLTQDDDCIKYSSQLICPILFSETAIGAVVLTGKKPMDTTEQKLVRTAADFLGRLMED